MSNSEHNPHEDEQDLDGARHGAAHVLAHLHFGQRFDSMGPSLEGWCEVVNPVWGTSPLNNARVALAGACADLHVDLVQDEGDNNIVLPWLETWRDDVVNREHGYRADLLATHGCVAEAAAWSLAFCRTNFDLIDEAAMMLVHAGAPIVFDVFTARFQGRTLDVSPEELEIADLDFAGGWHALERVDEAVADYLAAEGAK